MARLNTELESEAAEFLVLANLLLRKIPSFKNYTRHSGYDLIATNPITNKLAKIQVKSRYGINANGFPIKNFNSDFVIFCRLNKNAEGEITRDPEFFVFPTKLIQQNITEETSWIKFYLSSVKEYKKYLGNWKLITSFLKINC